MSASGSVDRVVVGGLSVAGLVMVVLVAAGVLLAVAYTLTVLLLGGD